LKVKIQTISIVILNSISIVISNQLSM